ncbi:Arabinanase/levansucrase/invertase [Epithele typhae]|uniref:Arabinanase/levansucrase/invertase n=1 Tax=Epithele typhae TaxID=378194 RepID=UPI002008598A|nr:Arabinanase/levansucrase/invertase [Epithele typhae]KAH9939373.1 Arabinanase/levansucrase/invertase [Epithele typhae]
MVLTTHPFLRATLSGLHAPTAIKPGLGADPWVIMYEDNYYLTYTTGSNVQVYKSSNLAEWSTTGTIVYTPTSPFTELWAPELHIIDGSFYIYVAMDQNNDNSQHRMYALKGTSTTDPTQPFELVGQVTSSDNNWAIDGTVMQYQNDPSRLYFIWSGWTNSSQTTVQNLYIAPMDSPTRISANRVLLHEPTPDWQASGGQRINEGPEIYVHDGRTFLIYSAAASWTQEYCLGFMGIDGGADPLVPSNWWRKDDGPVFWASDAAFGPGHASFTTDRDGVPYIVYHAMEDQNGGSNNRSIRAQTFGFNPDSSPAFPSPAGFSVTFPLPA